MTSCSVGLSHAACSPLLHRKRMKAYFTRTSIYVKERHEWVCLKAGYLTSYTWKWYFTVCNCKEMRVKGNCSALVRNTVTAFIVWRFLQLLVLQSPSYCMNARIMVLHNCLVWGFSHFSFAYWHKNYCGNPHTCVCSSFVFHGHACIVICRWLQLPASLVQYLPRCCVICTVLSCISYSF
jgi:hypothetical protein